MIDEKWHGTTNGYNNLRCRCDRCRAANAKAHAEYLAMVRAREIPVTAHGTLAGYSVRGCRCERCRRAYGEREHLRLGVAGPYRSREQIARETAERKERILARRAERRSFEVRYAEDENGCWVWKGTRMTYRDQSARIFAYERAGGVLPEHRQLFATCRNRRCVNPDHLIVPERRMSLGRFRPKWAEDQETCANGHPLTPDNIRIRLHDGHRECRACNAERCRRYRAHRLQEAA